MRREATGGLAAPHAPVAADAARSVAVLLPVKDLDSAKLRLAGILTPRQRRALVLAMLADVVHAARAAGLDVAVVSADLDVLDSAERAGARAVAERPRAPSLNAALRQALRLRCSTAAAALVVLPDTPLVSPHELLFLVSAENAAPSPGHATDGRQRAPWADTPASDLAPTLAPGASVGACHPGAQAVWSAPRVVLAPDRAERGTNALLLCPPDVIPPRFGRDSLARHLQAAGSLGVPAEVRRLSGLALDLDTPSDIRAFLATPSPTRTHRLLMDLHLAELFD